MKNYNKIIILITILFISSINIIKAQDCYLTPNIQELIDKEFSNNEEVSNDSTILYIDKFTHLGESYLRIYPTNVYNFDNYGSSCYYNNLLIIYNNTDNEIFTNRETEYNHIPKNYKYVPIEYAFPNFTRYYILDNDRYKRLSDEGYAKMFFAFSNNKKIKILLVPPPPGQNTTNWSNSFLLNFKIYNRDYILPELKIDSIKKHILDLLKIKEDIPSDKKCNIKTFNNYVDIINVLTGLKVENINDIKDTSLGVYEFYVKDCKECNYYILVKYDNSLTVYNYSDISLILQYLLVIQKKNPKLLDSRLFNIYTAKLVYGVHEFNDNVLSTRIENLEYIFNDSVRSEPIKGNSDFFDE